MTAHRAPCIRSSASSEVGRTDQVPALQVKDISKAFAGTQALDGVSASFPRRSVTGLLGQNGSGKSTLIKILAGFHAPDRGGAVWVRGVPLPLPVTPADAHRAGMRFLHQDLGLVADLTIADNLAFADGFRTRMLGRIRQREANQQVQTVLKRFGIDLSPATLISQLTPTERTMVAIARAFQDKPGGDESRRILILDEPTASLPASEVDRVFQALRRARDDGGAIIYVTHRIDEVKRIADRVLVLRDGKLVAHRELTGLSEQELVTMIVGRKVERGFSHSSIIGSEVALRVDNVTGRRLDGVRLSVRRGEILGVTGLLGCGRSELARVIAGAQEPEAGQVYVDDVATTLGNPRAAIAAGIAYVPQDRRGQGCIPTLSVRHNVTLGDLSAFWRWGWLREGRERIAVNELIEAFDVRPADGDHVVGNLSGGNQQKVVVAKRVRLAPKILVLDEPTQGVDIAGRREIGLVIKALADSGVAVILASSDFDELAQLCTRVLVLDRGHAVATVDREELTTERLTVLCTYSDTEQTR